MSGRRGTPAQTLGPAVAGSWYPGEAAALTAQIEAFLADAPAATAPGLVSALIVPHAGYVYSGPVAARGFGGLRHRTYDRVVLLGPSHHAFVDGAVIPAAARYRTPLGEVDLDTEALGALSSRAGFRVDDSPFRPEHCLEAEIPFLQHCLEAGWRLAPLLVGSLASVSAATLGEALRPLLGPRTLVVVSTDFTHYGPRFDYVPFDQEIPERIERLDMGAVRHILDWDADGFRAYVDETGATICGRNPIRVLMRSIPRPGEAVLTGYDTSGRLTGDWTHSVSYASLVFGGPGGETA